MKKRQARAVQYTLRGVPAEVDRILRQKARHRKQSLNRFILDELTQSALGQKQKVDFSDLVGAWIPDPGFDEIIGAQRQIDRNKWK